MNASRLGAIESAVREVIRNLSGRELGAGHASATFFDLGFDSLLLTQVSQSLRQKFGVKISFRQLMENLVTIEAVSKYIEEQTTAEAAIPSAPVAAAPRPSSALSPSLPPVSSDRTETPNGERAALIDRIVQQQFDVMNQQLDLLRANGLAPEKSALLNGATSSSGIRSAPVDNEEAAPRFGPYKPMDRSPGGGLTATQQAHLNKLIRAYEARTPRSKAYTQRHRARFADPRTVAGFRQAWKEIVYPIVVKHSYGTRFLDLDNNEYLDVTMGFGTNLFGHSPDFLTRALVHQLQHGVEVGPQSATAGKVASLMCELTGMERAAFCSTGSEAVLAAVRLARTVTGRTRIATTSGYHGINDEVLVRAKVVDGVRRPAPVAPGIPQHIVDEVLVLDYGTPESLEILRAHAHELAAVLVEPVQSRRPELQPVEFLREVRKITAEAGAVLVFDEIITGFRSHPGGTQALFGIEADLATYGKIIGGGMPIGALCGKARYMDALDGGHWQYGDDSSPEVGMTFFAGTYVRHPLAVRAALSVLTRLKREGPALQERLGERAARLQGELNAYFEREQIPMRMTRFGSMMYFAFQQEFKFSGLLFFHLRLRGLHIWEGRPVFLSTEHHDNEIDFIISAFKDSLQEMRRGDFLPQPAETPAGPAANLAVLSETSAAPSAKPMEFSLYFFGNYDAAYREDKYSLLKDAAKFGDDHGFTAVWLPERHFHAVGGFSPNASLLACALSSSTSRIQLRGGSVVLPLHHPVRVAEEWSVADNLSQGRVAVSVATGWHPNDFVFAPDAFEDRRNIALQNLDTIRKLWRGETIDLPAPGGEKHPVRLHPLPRQKELPVWLTCIHRESYAEAGRRGLNVLGYLMNQTVDELADKIAAYRDARRSAGLDPAGGHVTTLLFTYLDESVEKAREVARGPLCAYLRSYLDNSQKKIERRIGEVAVDEEDIDYLTNRSCDDYFNGKSLIGTPESCAAVVARLKRIGVDEIGCFVDFGIEPARVLRSLQDVAQLMKDRDASPPVDEILPLPPAEQGLWLLTSMNADAARAYRESVTLDLAGELDPDSLACALQTIVDRHGALRTTIDPDGRAQTVHARQEMAFDFVDYSALEPGPAAAGARRKMAALESGTFDGMRGPFLAGCLVKVETARHFLVLVFHHVVGNGPSYWVFLEELAALYQANVAKQDATLPPAFPFAEFVEKRRAYEASAAHAEAEAYWMKQLAGGVPVLDLPFDAPPPTELTYLGGREEIVLDPALTDALKKIGAAHRCSLFMVLLGAYGALLHRLAGQDDLAIGVPFDSPIRLENAGRNLFANTTNMLPLRSALREGSRFVDYLSVIKDLVLAAAEHQDYFFGELIGKLKLPRDPARAPFFNVVFNLESGEFERKAGDVLMTLETRDVPYRSPRGTAMFDLYLNAAERQNGEILVQCDHNAVMVSSETMRLWLGYYLVLLRAVAADPTQLVTDLPLAPQKAVKPETTDAASPVSPS